MRAYLVSFFSLVSCTAAYAEWTITSNKDRFTDITTFSATLDSSDTLKSSRISVNCNNKFVQVNLLIRVTPVPSQKQYGGFDILWKVETGSVIRKGSLESKHLPIVVVDWADKQRKYGLKEPMSIVNDMAKSPAGTIYVRVEGDDSMFDTKFDVSGTQDAMRRMAKDCEYPIISE